MVGRLAKAESRTANVYVFGESDGCVVPTKGPNNDGGNASAEGLEGRRPTKENTGQLTRTPDSAPGLCASRRCSVCVRPTASQRCKVAASIRGRSRMREFRSYGSVRGAPGNRRSYRDSIKGERSEPPNRPCLVQRETV